MLQVITLITGLVIGNMEVKASDFIENRILPQRWAKAKRSAYSKEIMARIVVEAKRRGLDPVALVAVGWVESHFMPWARRAGDGRRHGEVGPWQLILYDTYVQEANKLILGCNPGPKVPKRLVTVWEHKYKGEKCEDQTIADSRVTIGQWDVNEFQDPIISTYIAAFEISEHIKKHGSRGFKQYKSCNGLSPVLWQYGHFNRPGRPQRYYVERLCKRYKLIQAFIDGGK